MACAASPPSYEYEDAARIFRRDGVAVLPNFASRGEVGEMKDRMAVLAAAFAASGAEATVFRTDAGQESAQARARLFFESADGVACFSEEGSGEGSGDAWNKCGHGLHLADDAFGAYATSPRVRGLLAALGFSAPARRPRARDVITRSARAPGGAGGATRARAQVLPQSMYIFKAARVGGPVTPHQDATFLRTAPRQTVVGLWLALDDATADNGRVCPRLVCLLYFLFFFKATVFF
jgi:phytanoyl-CoA hydroxylase